jgi:hypothetical protein
LGLSIPNNTVGVSNYDSLQVVVNKRLSGGLEAQGAYTYGHSLDTPIGQLVGADCEGAPGMDTGVSSNTRAYDYGPSCFDVRHNFRMSLLYHFPNLKSNGVLSKLVDGWWMGNIVSLQTGLPFTPILATNRSNSGNLSNMPDRVDINTQAIAQGTALTNAEGGTYIAATNFIPYNPRRLSLEIQTSGSIPTCSTCSRWFHARITRRLRAGLWEMLRAGFCVGQV